MKTSTLVSKGGNSEAISIINFTGESTESIVHSPTQSNSAD